MLLLDCSTRVPPQPTVEMTKTSLARSPNRVQTGVTGWPLLALGFRPLYLVAALFSVAALPLWLAVYTGIVQVDGYLFGAAWHSHEMLFGFAAAVIAGFLLTAVRNWTGLPTMTGATLGTLVGVWLLARVLAVTGPGPLAAVVDVAFLPALGLAIALPIVQSRNTRNLKILAVVAGLAVLNTVHHLAYLEKLPANWAATSTRLALDLITLLMAIVGGRVIPAFTANAIAAANPRRIAGLEVLAVGMLVVILAADVIAHWHALPAAFWVALLAAAAVTHGVRLALWQPLCTRRNALLAMLPIAYGWIPIALALRALSQAAVVPAAAATHALTIGAMASLMLAMMMRSALGHTGRPLAAGRSEIIAFLLLQLAAAVRVLGTVHPDLPYRESTIVAGALWSLAFAVFLFRYWRVLTRPRVDGRPG